MKKGSSQSAGRTPMYDFSVLRTLRKREGMTLGQVSERSGISLAVISKLERNQTSAELETLFKLGRAFGMTATDLLAMAESPLAHLQDSNRYRSGDFGFERVRYANVTCMIARAKAGAATHRPEVHRDEYEVCWILEGRIRLSLPHESHELAAGQSLQFDAIQEHTYEALEDSKILLLHLRKDKRF